MSTHLTSAVERLIGRSGSTITVKRTTGTLDPVTSTRSAGEQTVSTAAVFTRSMQRSYKGDPLSTGEAYYSVPASPFAGVFTPRDADLVVDGTAEYRVMAVRTRRRSGTVFGYRLYVGGVV